MIDFDFPTNNNSLIRVIGVGGGGSNAVNHMYEEGKIQNVGFAVCNTDVQDLNKSTVPYKIQLGPKLTNGLGCGAKPEVGKMAAEESIEDIKKMLSDGTRMVFITAGMGGGTGTGAAPVIAKIAYDLKILTVGIVTTPFEYEGPRKIKQAIKGVLEMSKCVDALLIINNERLPELFKDWNVMEAFNKADNILADSAKSIADIITNPGKINVDFADVTTILKDSGVAIMNTGRVQGCDSEQRIFKAIENALESPLLKDNNIKGAKRILIQVYWNAENTTVNMGEFKNINSFIKSVNPDPEIVIPGYCNKPELGENEVEVTILATGYTFNKKEEETDEEFVERMYSELYSNTTNNAQPAYTFLGNKEAPANTDDQGASLPPINIFNQDIEEDFSTPAYKRQNKEL